MASVFFRGSKASPRWYARYLESGRWRARRVRVETKKDALKIARQLEARCERVRYGLEPAAPPMGMRELLQKFTLSLNNRSHRDDAARIRLHVAPHWNSFTIDRVTVAEIVKWIDQMKVEAKIAAGTQKHALSCLSRALAYGIARGWASHNSVRDVPSNARPRPAPSSDDQEWISDPATLRRIQELLPAPFNLVFYVCASSATRVSEALGLRLGDVENLADGSLRVAHSGNGPLKEDKRATGLIKFVPAATDALEVLGDQIAGRRAETGDDPEALLFPHTDGRLIPRYAIAFAWRKVRRALGLAISWHHATRTSAASRWASQGVEIGQISAALGHHGIAITQKNYMKWKRVHFDPRMTLGLATPAPGGNVTPIGAARASLSPPASVEQEIAGAIRHQSTGDGHAA